ncbi:DUF789 FAMILY PROTEIN [Salix purpurea]|uniref:DUF789 FAMILY PROTEIN n=1 Tax=Salix purpurea TaxID=77065 RepID=A0A9Q0USN3_SALPP|nr:DUF789 FAMILY PROTEIN [Salix purpurea]
MDGLQLVSMPPRNAFRDDRPKARRGPQPDAPHSIKSCTRNFLETGAWHQSQNEGSNKATRSNEFSDYPSSQSSVTCPDFYYSTTKGCNALSSCEACIDSSNADKSAKKKWKENNHSVWKKVQRNDTADECSTEMKISHGCFLSDLTLKEAPSLKRNCIVSDANSSAITEGKKLPKDKVTKKLKRKNIPGSKQEYNCHGRGYSSNKATFNAHANTESVNSSQVSPDGLQQLQNTCDTVSSTRHFHTENGGSLPAKLCNSLEQHAVKVPPPVYLPHLFFNKVPQLEKEVTVAEYCKQNHGSGSVMQKWIPIGVKDPELTTSARFGNSLPDLSDGPASEDLALRNVQDKANFDSRDLVSSLMLGTCHDSGNAVCFSQEDNHIHKLKNSTLWMDELNKKHVAADALTNKLSDQQFSAFEDESIKIIQSVKDACRVQKESEAIQMATGGPIAEF